MTNIFKIKGATFQPKLSATPFGLLYYLQKQRYVHNLEKPRTLHKFAYMDNYKTLSQVSDETGLDLSNMYRMQKKHGNRLTIKEYLIEFEEVAGKLFVKNIAKLIK